MTQPVFNMRRRKVGGIWFVRIGRFQLSFCLCRPETVVDAYPRPYLSR